MVSFTRKHTSKQVSFASISVNEIFYYDGSYWIKIYPIRDYDADRTYNAHTIHNEDCEFDSFDESDVVTVGEVEIITTF